MQTCFEGLGQLGPELQLEVNNSIKPMQLPPWKIPESLKAHLKAHLAELEKSGVIEKVHQPADWISSIIIAKKTNGKIRLSLDPRPLNQALKHCHHPMQTINDILAELGKAKVFSKVDCSNGYWQCTPEQRGIPTNDLCDTLWQIQVEPHTIWDLTCWGDFPETTGPGHRRPWWCKNPTAEKFAVMRNILLVHVYNLNMSTFFTGTCY